MTPDFCPISYQFEVSPALDSSVVTFREDSRTFTFSTSDTSFTGVYTITVTAVSPTGQVSGTSFSFEVTLVNPCLAATLTINESIFQANPIVYELASEADVVTLLDEHVSSDEPSDICPDIVFQITNRDGSPTDASVFTYDAAA